MLLRCRQCHRRGTQLITNNRVFYSIRFLPYPWPVQPGLQRTTSQTASRLYNQGLIFRMANSSLNDPVNFQHIAIAIIVFNVLPNESNVCLSDRPLESQLPAHFVRFVGHILFICTKLSECSGKINIYVINFNNSHSLIRGFTLQKSNRNVKVRIIFFLYTQMNVSATKNVIQHKLSINHALG